MLVNRFLYVDVDPVDATKSSFWILFIIILNIEIDNFKGVPELKANMHLVFTNIHVWINSIHKTRE